MNENLINSDERASFLARDSEDKLLRPSQLQPTRYLCCDFYLANVVLLGVSFLVLFTAFSAVQNFVTTVNKELGFWSLTLLYICFAFSNFVAPAIVKTLGPRISLIFGAVTYLAFIAANIKAVPEILLPVSCIMGVGAAVLWTAQGSFLSNCSDNTNMGLNSGIFFAIFQCSQITGNMGAAILLTIGFATGTVFTILMIVGSFSLLVILMLRKVKPRRDQGTEPTSTKMLLLETANLLRTARSIHLLVPIMIYSGFSQSFFFGVYPPHMGQKYIGYVMSVFGAVDAVGSVVLGKVSDRFGRKVVVVIATVAILAGAAIAEYSIYHADNIYLFFIAAVPLGLSDAGFNTQIYAVLGSFFPERSQAAFSIFKLFQAGSTAVAFFYGPYVTFEQTLIILGSALGLGLICGTICDRTVKSIEPTAANDSSM